MASAELRDFLGSVQEARFQYHRAVSREQELRERCEHMTTNWSSEPHGSGDVHRDGPLTALAQAHAELKDLYAAWEQAEEEVDCFLNRIRDIRYRAILQLRYVDLYSWPRIEEELQKGGIYYEQRQIFRLHGRALVEAEDLWENYQKEEKHGT